MAFLTHHYKNDPGCPPSYQENAIIKIDLANNDDGEYDGEFTAKRKLPDQSAA